MNTLDNWRAMFLRLPDADFFDILRNYLGEIRTPFHKPQLVKQLETLFLESTIRATVFALVDDVDRKVLTAVDVLAGPTVGDLFSFFRDDGIVPDLHRLLVNLEDRLLIFRPPESDGLFLNPLLAAELRAHVLPSRPLFDFVAAPPAVVASPPTAAVAPSARPAGDETSAVGDATAPPDRVFFLTHLVPAVCSYLWSAHEVLRQDGSLRKKNADELAQLLHTTGDCVSRVVRALEYLGLVNRSAGRLVPVDDLVLQFLRIEPTKQPVALIAAACATSPAAIEGLTATFLELATQFPCAKWLDGDSMRKFIRSLPVVQQNGVSMGNGELRLAAALGMLHRVVDADGGDWYSTAVEPPPATGGDEQSPAGSLHQAYAVVHPNFEVGVPPELPAAEVLFLAQLGAFRRVDTMSIGEITHAGCARLVWQGTTGAEITARLIASTGRPLPQNIAFSLEQWSNDLAKTALIDGTVLVADQRHIDTVCLADSTARFVLQRLSPTAVVMVSVRRVDWTASVRALGVMVPDPIDALGESSSSPLAAFTAGTDRLSTNGSDALATANRSATLAAISSLPWGRSAQVPRPDTARSPQSTAANPTVAPSDPLAVIRDYLAALDMPHEIREEYRLRLNRRLILHIGQISARSLVRERTEAKGLDYVGKVRLIETAVKTHKDLLEVTHRTTNGRPCNITVRPLNLKKNATELILEGETLPDRRKVSIQVSKINLVRKLRGNLFTPGTATRS